MIVLRNATKSYGGNKNTVSALTDVSLEIARGEKVCIVGRSGSGKTTLLDVLGTLLTLSSGVYELDGQNVAQLSEMQLAALRNFRFGFVFQAFHLIDRLTVLQNVLLASQYRSADFDYSKRARAALESMSIAHLAARFPQQLSGGEKQRVAIARAIAANPSVILADEPTGNLDSATGRQVMEALLAACGSEKALVLVTHDLSIAARFERVIRMQDGRVVAA